jgi:preprotein translocase subunit SecD
MSSLKTLLQHADPLRREAARLDAARERIRLTMLGARARAEAEGNQSSVRLVRLPILATVLVAVIVATMGYALWDRVATPVFAAVRFEIRLAEDQPAPGLVVAQVPASDRFIYLHPEIVANNDDIAEAFVAQDGDQFSVNVRFLPPGAQRLEHATKAHVGRRVAMLIDGRVAMAVVVRAPIGEWAVITGPFSRADAERIAHGIEGR